MHWFNTNDETSIIIDCNQTIDDVNEKMWKVKFVSESSEKLTNKL